MTNTNERQKKLWLEISYLASQFQQLKRQCICYLVTVVILLMTPMVWSLDLESSQEAIFGKPNDSVNFTVNGALQTQSLVVFDEFISKVNTNNALVTNSIGHYVNTVTMNDSSISISNLQNSWHFLIILIKTSVKDRHHLNSLPAPHVNSTVISTAEIEVGRYYEVGQYEKRRLLFQWPNQSTLEFKDSTPDVADKLYITNINITGFLRK
jgi:hypothetical protein